MAEMLQVLVGYILGAGVAVRWLVIAGNPDFFSVTKRIHNRLHGVPGDGGGLAAAEAAVLRVGTGRQRRGRSRPTSDPLTWSSSTILRPQDWRHPLKAAGAVVLWRCHVGTDAQQRLDRGGLVLPAAAIWTPVTASCSRDGSTCRPGYRRTESRSSLPRSTRSHPRTRSSPRSSDFRSSPPWGYSMRGPPGRLPSHVATVRWARHPAGNRRRRRAPRSPRYLSCSRCLVGTT